MKYRVEMLVRYNILDGMVHFNILYKDSEHEFNTTTGSKLTMPIPVFREFRFRMECPFAHHPDTRVIFTPDQTITSEVGHHRAEAVTRPYANVELPDISVRKNPPEWQRPLLLNSNVEDYGVLGFPDDDPSNAL